MVESDTANCEEPVTLSVVHSQEVRVRFGNTVRTARIERRQFGLRDLAHFAEHLARRRLVEPDPRINLADRFQQTGHAKRSELAGEYWLIPGGRHEALRSKVVNLVRFRRLERGYQRCLVEQVTLNHLNPVGEMRDAFIGQSAGSPCHADDAVALLKQEFREVRAILACNTCDEGRPCHGT